MSTTRSHPSRRTALVGAVGSLAAAVLFLPPAAAAAGVPTGPATPSMTLAAGSAPMTLIKTEALPGGDVATTWQLAGGAIVRAAGQPGSQVFARVGTDTAEAWVDPPAGAAALTPAQAIGRYRASGGSIYWDAIGTGATTVEAIRIARSSGVPVPAAAHVTAADLAAAGPDPGLTVQPAGTIFNTPCAIVYGGYKNATYKYGGVYGRACLTQTYLQQKAPDLWYIENKIITVGQSRFSGLQPMTGLQGHYCYCANGFTYDRIDWDPQVIKHVGAATNYTLSVSWSVITVTVSGTLQPDTLTPVYPSGVSQPAFGSRWNGQNWNPESANSLAIIHNGHASPSNASIHVTIWWTTLG